MRLLILLLGIFVTSLNFANDLYPLRNKTEKAQFEQLLKELRCLVCQNQDLADSNAGLAKDLRQEIYHRVKKGQSSKQIKHFLIKRYGDFILFKPPVKSLTWALWFGPLLFLSIGLLIFWRVSLRQNSCN